MNHYTNAHIEPALSSWHWHRHGRRALRHESGSVVIFHGPHAERNARECLRQLNKIPKPKRGKPPAGLDLL